MQDSHPMRMQPQGWRQYFRPGFQVTPIVIAINVGIFLLMAAKGLGFMSFSPEDLLLWGGAYTPLIYEGQWWRLVTSMFLHVGLLHLAFNMYALFSVAPLLEPIMGAKKYTCIYLLSGLAGSILSLMSTKDAVGVGASGAIFGMFGLSVALILRKVYPPTFSQQFLRSNLMVIGINLVLGFTNPNIGNLAHIGGLVAGFALGFAIRPEKTFR